ncbi:MAG TPA: S41 family peptidase [Bacillota bacterium]
MKRIRRVISLFIIVAVLASLAVALSPSRAAAGDRPASDGPFLDGVMNYIQSVFYKEVDRETLLAGAIRGILQALNDPYSEYLPPEAYNGLMQDVGGSFGGIGISITADNGRITVLSPIRGTPAEAAGLLPGDAIVEVDGKSILGISTDEAAGMIRGTPGTKVQLGILRGMNPELIRFEVTRAVINVDPVESKDLGNGMAYIRLTEFNENATAKLDAALKDPLVANAKGLVLDLRNNPGGALDQAISVAERFLPPNAVVVQIVGRNTTEKPRTSLDAKPWGKPLVVLVNKGSASASEILAGALKDFSVATLVGTRTYGKGSVQNVIGMYYGAGMRITVAHFLSPAGNAIDTVGVTPHILAENRALPEKSPYYLGYLDGKRDLKSGSVGLDVAALQDALRFLGYVVDDPQGTYGAASERAVRSFRKSIGLPVNGGFSGSLLNELGKKVQFETRDPSDDIQLKAAIKELSTQIGQ